MLSLLDLQFVVKFSEDCAPDQLRYLVHSLCPDIYGHELVKARSACALFELMHGMSTFTFPNSHQQNRNMALTVTYTQQ